MRSGILLRSLLGCLGVCVLFGCGGNSSEQDSSDSRNNPQAAPPANTTNTSVAATQQPAQAPTVDPNRKETKWIGEIPYDVFYDQPLTIAADPTVLGGAPTQDTSLSSTDTPAQSGTTGTDDSTAPSSASAASGSVDWARIMPIETIQSETKAIRARLTANLQTVATYNRNTDQIALDGAMMSALGAIITMHPNADSWKERGKFVRDLGYEVYMNTGESGRAAYQSVEEPFLKLQTALDGGTVDGVDAEEVVPFADVVYVSEMMKRIEASFNSLKANVNTADRLKEDVEGIEREARMLAALGAMMGTESYDNADAKMYQEFIKTFVDGALAAAEAAKAENYDGFRDGLNQIQTTCAECHQQYRGSESGF